MEEKKKKKRKQEQIKRQKHTLGPEGPARQRGVVVVRQYAQLLSSQPLLLGSTDPGLCATNRSEKRMNHYDTNQNTKEKGKEQEQSTISGLESSIAFNLVLVELKQSARWLRSDVCCSWLSAAPGRRSRRGVRIPPRTVPWGRRKRIRRRSGGKRKHERQNKRECFIGE